MYWLSVNMSCYFCKYLFLKQHKPVLLNDCGSKHGQSQRVSFYAEA